MKRVRRFAVRFTLCAVLLLALCMGARAETITQSPDAVPQPASSAAAEESFFSHFCGHFTRSLGVDTTIDAASLLLDDEAPDWWQKLKSAAALAGKSIPALISGGFSWQAAVALLSELWEMLPKENFKRLMRDLLKCPRCRDFAYDFTIGLGESAWQKLKDGGSWVGEKTTTFLNWIWSDDEQGSEAEQKPGFWASAWEKTTELSGQAWQKTKDGCGWLGEKTSSAWNWTSEHASSAWSSLWNSERSADEPPPPETTKQPRFWVSAWEKTAELSGQAWQKTKDGGSWLGEKAGSAWDWMGESAGSVWQKTKDGGSWVKEQAADLWRWAWE